jgi:hypothetical protein
LRAMAKSGKAFPHVAIGSALCADPMAHAGYSRLPCKHGLTQWLLKR